MVILSDSPSAKAPTIYYPTNNTMLDDATEDTKNSKMMDSPKTSIDTEHHTVDNTVEFAGDVNTNNEIPSQEVLRKVESMLVLDKDGKTRPFKTLYSGPNVARRVLIIFIRHFFCGVCFLSPRNRCTKSELTLAFTRTAKNIFEPSLHPSPRIRS
jgi:hypothetical protein